MAPEITEQSPSILQGLASVADPLAQQAAAAPPKFDSGTARIPQPEIPMRPGGTDPGAKGEAPVAPTDDELGIHPVDNMAMAFMSHLLDKDKEANQPAAPPAPGSFGSKLAGALSSAGAGLGDVRTGGNPAQGHGWLSAVGATLNARTERKEKEQATSFDQQERLKNDQINIAKANIEMRHLALAVQQQEETLRDKTAAQGSTFMDSLRDNFHVQDNITQDELTQMATKDPDFLRTHTGRITGYRPVIGADGQQKVVDGQPVEEPVYSVVNLAPGDLAKQYKVSDAVAKQWEESGLHKVAPGTVMPVSVANEMDARAARYSAVFGMLDKGRLEPLPNAVKDELATTMENPEVQHAVASNPRSVLEGLYSSRAIMKQHVEAAQNQLQQLQGTQNADPRAVKAAQDKLADYQKTSQDIDKVLNLGFTDKERGDYFKQKDEDIKAAEKERHDRAEEQIANRRADIAAQKEVKDKNLAASYKLENTEFDTIRKPLTTQLDAFATLRSSLDQGTAAGDSVVAPALLKALVAGGGVRITQAEIQNFTHGRSTLEDMRGYLQKLTNGKSITPEQRQQVYDLLGAVEARVQLKNKMLLDAQDQLDAAQTVDEQRAVVNNYRRMVNFDQHSDAEALAGPQAQRQKAAPAPAAPKIPASAGPNARYAKDANKKIVGYVDSNNVYHAF